MPGAGQKAVSVDGWAENLPFRCQQGVTSGMRPSAPSQTPSYEHTVRVASPKSGIPSSQGGARTARWASQQVEPNHLPGTTGSSTQTATSPLHSHHTSLYKRPPATSHRERRPGTHPSLQMPASILLPHLTHPLWQGTPRLPRTTHCPGPAHSCPATSSGRARAGAGDLASTSPCPLMPGPRAGSGRAHTLPETPTYLALAAAPARLQLLTPESPSADLP